MRIASLLVLLMLVSSTAFADQPALAAAAQAAAGGDYRAAVREYEQTLAKEGFSAPVLFNLGNAWLRLGNPARCCAAARLASIAALRGDSTSARS